MYDNIVPIKIKELIINYTENGWEVITQRAHGILAAQLAMHWNKKGRPDRWTETVLAIAEHDDAEVELDGETLLTSKGGPLNFDMKAFDLAHCQKLNNLCMTKSRYIQLLTSMHMDFLYRKDAGRVAGAKAFLKEEQKRRMELRNALGMTKEAAEKIYCLMEWFDACSLLLCQRLIPPEKRTIEISHGPDGIQYHLFQPDKTFLSVTPWPFQSNDFTVHYESRLITGIQFDSSQAFRKAFLAAPVRENICRIRKSKVFIQAKTEKV